MSAAAKHEESRIEAAPHFHSGVGVEIISSCSCGARWTHPSGRSDDEKDAIFASHVQYFQRSTVTL